MRGHSSGRVLAVLLALLLAGLLWFWFSRAAKSGSPPVAGDTLVVARPAGSATAQAKAGLADGARPPTPARDDIFRTVEENSVPGRMVFLNFRITPSGVDLLGATGAAGRAKASARRTGPGLLEYEVFDGAGQLVSSGAVEDPTHRSLEHPDSSDSGRIQRTTILSAEGVFAIRVSGESRPARIVLYRAPVPESSATPHRAVLAEFPLRPTP